jgi:hypothetical protein
VDPKATVAFKCYADLADDTRAAVVEEYVDDDTTKLAHGYGNKNLLNFC